VSSPEKGERQFLSAATTASWQTARAPEPGLAYAEVTPPTYKSRWTISGGVMKADG
jgi:hypothetical protein